MADYFSPAIASMQKYLGLKTKDVFYALGQHFGQKAAERFAAWSVPDVLMELGRVWRTQGMGRLEVERTDPLTLTIHDCVVCGQLAGTGDMFSCAFHEGFFQALLSAKLQRKIRVRQEANYAGVAGTLPSLGHGCRTRDSQNLTVRRIRRVWGVGREEAVLRFLNRVYK